MDANLFPWLFFPLLNILVLAGGADGWLFSVQLRLAAWAASTPGCLPPLLQLSPTVLQDELMGGCSAEMSSLGSLITRLFTPLITTFSYCIAGGADGRLFI